MGSHLVGYGSFKTPRYGGRVIKIVPEKALKSIFSEEVDFLKEDCSPLSGWCLGGGAPWLQIPCQKLIRVQCSWSHQYGETFFFFFITLEPRVE